MAEGILLRLKLYLARREIRNRRSQFYFELGSSMREHVPLVSVLRKYETRARLRGENCALVYLEILRSFQNGTMSSAMQHIATPLEQTLMDATQSAGDGAMADGLQFLAETVDKVEKMRATLAGAVVYPLVLLSLFAFMLTMFSLLAVPVLVELMAPEKWPPLGKILYQISQVVTQHGISLLGTAVCGLILFLYSLDRWTGPWRQKFDDHFPYNIYRDFSGALLLISLASMMKAGISLRASLMRTQNFASPWMRWHVRKILMNLSRSNSPYFGMAFQTGVLNREMSDRVQDASERRNPVEAFIRTGSRAIDFMASDLEKRAKMINMCLLLICGLLLGIMFAGFMSTATSMQSGLREVH